MRVVAGTGDTTAAAVGAGATEDYDAHLYVGTSAWLSCHVPFKRTDVVHNIASLPSVVPGTYWVATVQDVAGKAVDWLLDSVVYAPDGMLDATPRPTDALERLNALAASAPPGCNGVVFTPWLNGERTPVDDPSVRGGWFNVSLSTTRADLARSVFEGIALNTRWMLEAVERFTRRARPEGFSSLRFVGGGARSPLWCQTMADVLQVPVHQIADPVAANARGAALIAAIGVGALDWADVPVPSGGRGHLHPRPDDPRRPRPAVRRVPGHLPAHPRPLRTSQLGKDGGRAMMARGVMEPPDPRSQKDEKVRWRTLLRGREFRTSAVAGAVVLLLVVVLAVVDPTGLLAPMGGQGMPVVRFGGVYQWAPLMVGLPVLLAGTMLPVYALARSGRTLFAFTWVAVVGAVATAAAATGFAAALPLVDPHLSVVAALKFSVATSGFAGLKGLVAGPLVGAAALLALGRRASGTAGETASGNASGTTPARGSGQWLESGSAFATGVTAVVVALTAVGSSNWRGGPVGYAFAGPLLAPTSAASALGTLAGMVVFLGLFALTVRSALRRLPGKPPLAVWLAALVASVGLGVVGAVVAALTGHLDDAGPDSWWIATTLISLATGIGYGVGVGLIAALATGVTWRWRARAFPGDSGSTTPYRPRARTWIIVGAVVILLAVPLVVPTTNPGPKAVAPVPASDGMERLHLLPAQTSDGLPVIGDVTGRRVLLRGVNVNQLIDYYLRDPEVPATQKPTDDDFAQIASHGFSVVRLGMSWSRLEPTRGEFDEAYLDEIRAAVESAKEHGLYTVLDMHEDAWGNALAAAPDEQCGAAMTPTTGWDGAPAWATITDGAQHCQFMARDLAPAVATAYTNFYTDRDGIQTQLIRTWATVAKAFADEPAVAGYDLFNEPGIGATPPVSNALLLGRYYDAAIRAIRDAETPGFAHLVFIEPSVLWSGLAFDVTPPPGFTSDTQLVFAPHPYSESISLDQSLGLTIASIERNLAMSAEAAKSYGAALWLGEWGWFGDPDVDKAKVQRFVAAQDRLGVGGAFWVWRQGCGSPETGDDAESSGNFVSVDCRTGKLSPPPEGFAEPLSRAYPRAFPGRLDSLASGGADLAFTATVDDLDINCQLDIWVPGDARPNLTTTGVTGADATQVDGGWQVTGCASGSYSVDVSA